MKKRLITYLYLIIHLFVAGDISLFANDDTECRIVHRIGVNVRPSYILPTHGFYNGWNPLGKALKVGGSIHADYSFEYSPTSTIGQMYPGSYQGVGIGIQSFCAHQMLGTPFCLYLFQGSPVAQLGKYLTLDYEWNFGISGGWKPHSSAMLLSSEYNAYINVGGVS